MEESEFVSTEPFHTEPKPDIFSDLKIVDCDTHWVEPSDLWTSRAPVKWKDLVPRVESNDGFEQWVLGDEPLGNISVRTVGSGRVKHRGTFALDRVEDVDPASYDAKERVALMDELHVYAQIVYPNAAGFGGNTFGVKMEPEVRNFCVQAYNDAAAEWAAVSGGRLYPQALVPFWDIRAAAKEAERASQELGLSGVTASMVPQRNPGTPDYGDTAWDPFWEVCQEYNIPLSFHTGSVLGGLGSGTDSWASMMPKTDLDNPRQMRAAEAADADVMRSVAAAVPPQTLFSVGPISHLIMSGLLDRWPRLKFVLVETGIGWIPWMLEYMDFNQVEMSPVTRFGLERTPSEYFHDNMYAMWWFERSALRNLVNEIGASNILWETDFPHPVCLFPSPLTRAADTLKAQTPEVRRKVMQDNAVNLWKIR
jgi:predicted TIM-barrel fold metal-dependent hydrolase